MKLAHKTKLHPQWGGTVQQAKQASGGNFEAKKVVTQGELAKRLNVHSASIGRYRKKGNLAEWSAKKDPDQKSWAYVEEKRGFVPVES